MGTPKKPRLDLAQKTLPKPLLEAITHVFAQDLTGCMLVGGTALAGFYAGHRRSDDLDLFTQSADAQKATVLAVKSLQKKGASFQDEMHTAQYYKSSCHWQGHSFTVDVVEDSNLFRVGQFVTLENKIHVASFETLLMTKAATLVSRCSEKDLYDLLWILEYGEGVNLKSFIELGYQIDLGMTGESLLLSISGSNLSQEACDFSLDPKKSSKDIFKEISQFKSALTLAISQFLKKQPYTELSEIARRVRKASK